MKDAARWLRLVMAVLTIATSTGALVGVSGAAAADLPLAATSPLTGVAFDDQPLALPVQRNFQMAMLTAGSELGRSCGNMEAYGWRMSQSEQGRVNQIFNNTVDRMRGLGYDIQTQNLTSVSNDITLFTADDANRHFMFLWSAGELGLVMTLCETSAPLAATYRPTPGVPSVQTFPVPDDMAPVRPHVSRPQVHASSGGNLESRGGFTPLGEWEGGYTCDQGYTGGSLQITHVSGKDFEGVFKFYPTPKNPNVQEGAYNIYGQYDKTSHRILINPGKWITRPPHYYNTVIVGSFDPMGQSFSGFFQGISGCTSFEAKRVGDPYPDFGGSKKKKEKPVKKPVKKKKVLKTHPAEIKLPLLTPDAAAPQIQIPPAAAVTPAIVVPAAPASVAATPMTTSVPAAITSTSQPAATPPATTTPVTPPASIMPAAPVPASTPAPAAPTHAEPAAIAVPSLQPAPGATPAKAVPAGTEKPTDGINLAPAAPAK